MGLDLIELVMAVEERFGIELSDAEAESAETPAKLIDLILSKVQTAPVSGWMTRHAFYALRRELVNTFSWHRSEIVPEAKLEQLIPKAGRQEAWERLGAALKAKDWPDLSRPAWFMFSMLGVFVAGGLVARFALHVSPWWLWMGLPLWMLMIQVSKPLCYEFPRHRSTVGQLTTFLAGAAPQLFEPAGRSWSRSEVAAVIRDMTVEELGLKPGQYREDARFVEDLAGG